MANAIYPAAKEAFLNKEHDLNTDAIKATLIDSLDYTYGAGHTTYADATVPAAAKVAVATLASLTIALGVFDCADFSWTTVTGDQCEAVILWNDTPVTPTADPLIAFYDTSMTGMPVTPSGGNINFAVNASGFFAL